MGSSAKIADVTHVIFDVDGLILDTERLFTEATQLVLKRYDREFKWEHKRQCMGLKHHESVALLLKLVNLDDKLTVAEFTKQWDEQLDVMFATCVLLPGAERLIRHLVKHNIPIAICTGSQRRQYDIKISSHQALFDLFHHAVLTTDDPEVKRGKPDPQCYQIAMTRFNPPPSAASECLVFEDAPNGVVSAIGAGMYCVMVPDPRVSDQDRKTATMVLNSLEEFKPELFGLPAFD